MATVPRFIGSAFVGPGHGWITLRGEFDAHAVELVDVHIAGFLGAATRTLTVDATRVTSCDPLLIELLGSTRERLTASGGAVNVIGLDRDALVAARPARPVLTVVPPPSAPST